MSAKLSLVGGGPSLWPAWFRPTTAEAIRAEKEHARQLLEQRLAEMRPRSLTL